MVATLPVGAIAPSAPAVGPSCHARRPLVSSAEGRNPAPADHPQGPSVPETLVTRHELNERFDWRDPARAPSTLVTEDQARCYDDLGYFVLEDAFDADALAAMMAEIDPLEAQIEEALRSSTAASSSSPGPTRSPSPPTWSPNPRRCAPWSRPSPLREPVPRPDRSGRAALLGPGRLQEARHRRRRSRGTRTTATPSSSRSSTSPAGSRSPTPPASNGCPWVVPGLHRLGTLAHDLTDTGFVCLNNPPDAVAVPGPGRQHRRVLVADTPLHRPQPHPRRAQGLHRAVRARRRRGADGRRRRRDRSATRRTTPAGSSPSCARVGPSRRTGHAPGPRD